MAKKTPSTPAVFVSSNQIAVKEHTIGTLSIGKNDLGYVALCDVCNVEMGAQESPANAVEALAVHTAVEHQDAFVEWAKKYDLPMAQILALLPPAPVQVIVKAPRVRKPKAPKAAESVEQIPPSPLLGEDAELALLPALLEKFDKVLGLISKTELAKANDALAQWQSHEAMLDSKAYDLAELYTKGQSVIEEYGNAIEEAVDMQTKHARVPALVASFQNAVDTTSRNLAILIDWTVEISNAVPMLLDRGLKISVVEKARREREAAENAMDKANADKLAAQAVQNEAQKWLDGQDTLLSDLIAGRQRVWNGTKRGWFLDVIGRAAINELEDQKRSHKDEEGFNPAAFSEAMRKPIIHQTVDAQLKALGFTDERVFSGTKFHWTWDDEAQYLTSTVLKYNELSAKKSVKRENGKGRIYPTYESLSGTLDAIAKHLPICEEETFDTPLGTPVFRADARRSQSSEITARVVTGSHKANGNENIPVGNPVRTRKI